MKEQASPTLPTKEDLQERVEEFKRSLQLPLHKLREIEQSTRDQHQSPLWYSVRQYRITASYFGAVYRRKASTPPQSLVLQIIGAKQFTSQATEWGKVKESAALQMYKNVQNQSGHDGLFYSKSGFVISEQYPFLGASPDAVVHDTQETNPFGLAEVKCPYSVRNLTPIESAESSDFFCTVSDDKQTLKLKTTHPYYCQVQSQMDITKRTWCDFIVYTEKGISIERIKFDLEFWRDKLLPKLVNFYDNCLAPEIVCPIHVLGLPVRNLQDM